MPNIFPWKRRNQYSIQKFNSFKSQNIIDSLSKELRKIDQDISQASQDLFEVQAAKIRATFSGNANWFNKLQKEIYWSTIQKSSSFNQQRLINLYKERREVQNKLDRASGQFWKKRIFRWLTYTFLCLILLFCRRDRHPIVLPSFISLRLSLLSLL